MTTFQWRLRKISDLSRALKPEDANCLCFLNDKTLYEMGIHLISLANVLALFGVGFTPHFTVNTDLIERPEAPWTCGKLSTLQSAITAYPWRKMMMLLESMRPWQRQPHSFGIHCWRVNAVQVLYLNECPNLVFVLIKGLISGTVHGHIKICTPK